MLAVVDAARLRGEFPVLRRLAFLNAGTDGPVPARAVDAARAELEREAADGRFVAHFERRGELSAAQRAAYAALLHCEPADVALTASTSEAMSVAIAGLELHAGDEIITSDEEHPGMLGPLQAARDLRGASITVVPFDQLADAAAGSGPRLRLVACSHVSWMSGRVAPAELAQLDVPVLLDGAQGVGAIPVDVRSLGCQMYAGAGQKWLCGPDGTGMLFVAPEFRDLLAATARSYLSFVDAGPGLDAELHPDARRYDTPALSAEASAFALAALDTVGSEGWPAVHERARSLAVRLAEALTAKGRAVVPRGDTTLVSFHSNDPVGERALLAERGVVVRDVPGRPWLRASVGAWNDDGDLERLVDGLAA
jgi:L-cysteine/cystine lyase